ncbi:MAG: adaptor protein MecA [Deltaproteobacteria bacterium]
MKIEKVSDNKIKVTLSTSDLRERNLDFSALTYNSPQAQVLFWDMLHQAEIEFGFSASDSQLFIEAAPSAGDSLIITLTKVEEDGDFESIQKYIRNRFKRSELKTKKKSKKISSGIFLYSFDEFEDLCKVVSKISELYSGESTLYKYDQTYYLMIANTAIANTNPNFFDSLMSEYGLRVTNIAFTDGFLNEYGTKLIEYNAIEVINDYFKA